MALPSSLEQVRITSLPPDAYYISDFISEEEERMIQEKIITAPKPRWTQLTHRRLQTWPSALVQNTLLESPLPQWLDEPVVSRLLSVPLSTDKPTINMFSSSPHARPNHVLINEYPPGIGIMPHKDGSAYHPVVCTVSLGASLCLNIYKSNEDGALDPKPAYRILQEPRSLLITTQELYNDYLHGIADIDEDLDLSEKTVANWALLRSPEDYSNGRNVRQTRTSLTYRDVLKVSKLGNKLGKFLKR
ncbi:putative alkbh6 protein [Phaeoacremonium minimum UCRPA7]|uniref:Putative alkbh6 protein n=1 Tax=Phaeoacremonium minimum (strain UCR-PA7) TaxID=1286976 RepID=R8BU39_PHAM7|nr:putative alkbh6 protein [Phaeoacremonium minimum UCRPA7]EOO02814.1 putative alkbh6 protein [Phaeoacremonium minimum UCRPA7]